MYESCIAKNNKERWWLVESIKDVIIMSCATDKLGAESETCQFKSMKTVKKKETKRKIFDREMRFYVFIVKKNVYFSSSYICDMMIVT